MNPSINVPEEALVKSLGEKIGYGRMMQLAQQEWRKMLTPQQMQGAEFAYGPCVSSTVTCSCRDEGKVGCDWCGGSGWVTKKVREMQEKENMSEPKQEKVWKVLGHFKYLNNETFFEINEEETEVRVRQIEHPFSKHRVKEPVELVEIFTGKHFISRGKDLFNSVVHKIVYYVSTSEVSLYGQHN